MVSTFARGNCMWRANHVRYLTEHERGGWLACMHRVNGEGNQHACTLSMGRAISIHAP